MAVEDWVAHWAAATVRQGLSARAGLIAYREAGGHITDATWFRSVGEARSIIAQRGDIVGAPLDRRPLGSEMVTWTTRHARGVIQQVEVMVQDRATGAVLRVPYSHRTQTGTTWRNAISTALDFITPEGTDGDQQRILGAVPVGAYRMRPGG